MSTTLTQEARRALKYVELGFEDLVEQIKEAAAEGLSYDLVIMKNGEQVTEVPVALAGILAGIGILPIARLVSIAGLTVAGFAGYTFKFAKKPVEET